MAKKTTNRKKTKRPAKLSYLKKEEKIRSKKISKKIVLKNAKNSSYNSITNEKLDKKEEQKQDLISKSFFDAQSSIKVNCCFCDNNLNYSIKIILEPFPKINIPLKKYSLPFELICLKCLTIKLKSNCREIKSLNFFNESNPHKYTHYRIINKMEEPIFTSDWSFGDEIKLLGALSRLGLGNWDGISNAIGKGKFECESHYYTFYYKKENDFMPKINDNLNKSISIKNEKYKKELRNNKIEENKLLAKIGNDLCFVPFSSDLKLSNRSININRNNAKSEHKNSFLLQNACNTLGIGQKEMNLMLNIKMMLKLN